MEPITVALLVALVTGVGGEFGRESLAGLRELVRRPFSRRHAESGLPQISSGEAELDALEAAPGDPAAGEELRRALELRAVADEGFAPELGRWLEQAERILDERGGRGDLSGDGGVSNRVKVTGGFTGNLIQARDIAAGIRIGGVPGSAPEAESR